MEETCLDVAGHVVLDRFESCGTKDIWDMIVSIVCGNKTVAAMAVKL